MSKVIIFPTDTVYGIGCSIFDKQGIERIYKIKKRPRNKPLACLCANIEQIYSIAYVNEMEEKVIKNFLPGALTLILTPKENIKEIIGFDTIGVRIPNSKFARKILLRNGPMLTTSVNESGQISLNDFNEIKNSYASLVDEILSSNESSSAIASTVVSLKHDEIEILREGQIKLQDIQKILQ